MRSRPAYTLGRSGARRRRAAIRKSRILAGAITIVPAIEGGARDAELVQGTPHRE